MIKGGKEGGDSEFGFGAIEFAELKNDIAHVTEAREKGLEMVGIQRYSHGNDGCKWELSRSLWKTRLGHSNDEGPTKMRMSTKTENNQKDRSFN